MPAREALDGLVERVPSERVEALVGAILSQERAGGDLAELLRRHARAAAEPAARREGGALGDRAGAADRRNGRRACLCSWASWSS